MKPVEKLLCELIALPSVNPAFLPANDLRAGETRVGEFLAATAARAGLSVEFRPVFPNRSNLLARLSPSGKVQQRILLAPHLDTVNASEQQFTPFKRNGRLFGRGASDTKGSVAAMFSSLCALATNGPRPKQTEIIFAGLVDEEHGQAGSRALAASGFKANLAIVGEPTQLRVVTAHKGDLWLQLETRGKAAHSSRPYLGVNAVHLMSKIVHVIETEYASMLRKRRHPLLGHATVNVGTISGGTQANIVPDHCQILIDRRTLPGETDAAVGRELLSWLGKHKLKARLANSTQARCLPMETDARLPLIQQLLAKAGQTRTFGADFFCDASILAQGKIPSVVFGPGSISQGHTEDEWIALRSLERAEAILLKFLQSLP